MMDPSSNFVLATTPPIGASAQPDYIQSGNELYTERNIMLYIQTKLTHKIKMSRNKRNTHQKKKKKNKSSGCSRHLVDGSRNFLKPLIEFQKLCILIHLSSLEFFLLEIEEIMLIIQDFILFPEFCHGAAHDLALVATTSLAPSE